MKSYKVFIFASVVLFITYIIAEIYRPQETDWTVSFSEAKKTPYGCYVLYHELKNIFPDAAINTYREPLYNKLHKKYYENSALILISSRVKPGEFDAKEAVKYVEAGNYIFMSSPVFSSDFLDTLGLKIKYNLSLNFKDSIYNFVNPALKTDRGYFTDRSLLDMHSFKINRPDSVIILGVNGNNQPNFVRVNVGEGAFFIHTDPFCFSNYFMLEKNNNEYAAKALSYLPSDVTEIMWDEYYKLGREGATTPLRFFLSNAYLRWALWLSVIGLLLFVLFEMKRRQKIIPVIEPLRNTTLDFIKTVANVYFNQKDNAGIANKKIIHWLEFIRQRFFISTQQLDAEFIAVLSKKSSVAENEIQQIIDYQFFIQNNKVNDSLLMQINNAVDEFYLKAK